MTDTEIFGLILFRLYHHSPDFRPVTSKSIFVVYNQ